MDCRVVVEAAVPVYDVQSSDEAVRIAISKTGEMLNPDLNYVEISMGDRACPHCGEALDPAFVAADESLVALELEMTVFNVERDEHASRIARKEIGQRLENIPLTVLSVEEIESEEADEEADPGEGDDAEAESAAGDDDSAYEDDVSASEDDDSVFGDDESAFEDESSFDDEQSP
jgi:uncharacterized protein (UPF0212 family)